MFQFDWGAPELWSQEPAELTPEKSAWADSVRGVMLLEWQEHCVECVPPLCYSTCPLYVQRRDRRCARLVYGIVRNPRFKGLLDCGADLKFRRWGKIEARLTGRYMPLLGVRLLDRADRLITWTLQTAETILRKLDPECRILNGAAWRREKLLARLGKKGVTYDGLAVECYSFQPEPCRLIVELRKNLASIFRASLELKPGSNQFSLAIPLPSSFGPKDDYLLTIYPEGDAEIRVVFTWLDFVVHARSAQPASLAEGSAALKTPAALITPAIKVKCVAWDLDNTLWRGILVEDGEQGIQLRPEAEQLVRGLDERGIVQTIVSKNNHDDAMAVVKKFGLEEFFLYPAINWGPKSANLQQIADHLNIGIDAFALIDDSPFERREVSAALPMVRVYPEDNLANLLQYPEFDVPVTEASRLRRKSYLTEMQREKAKDLYGADFLEFLRSCQLKLRVFQPVTETEIARCHELIQRSNQLNLSSRRYEADEFAALLADSAVSCFALECEDRFGSYGIVGFASIDKAGEYPVARDFVLSCRVAQKRVEHAFYGWLGDYLKQQGANTLMVQLVKTAKNAPLRKVFEEMPFTAVNTEGDTVLLAMDLRGDVSRDSVVTVDDAAFASRRNS
jgi:FkbH-like protein